MRLMTLLGSGFSSGGSITLPSLAPDQRLQSCFMLVFEACWIVLASNVHAQETCDYDDYDHDADDVENVHCALRLRHARLRRKTRRLQ